MIILGFLIGVLLVTITGWLSLRHVEGLTPLLQPLERWVMGFALGGTVASFAFFLMQFTNLGVSRLSWLITFAVLIGLMSLGLKIRKLPWRIAAPNLAPSTIISGWKTVLIILSLALMVAKLLLLSGLVFSELPFHDDVVKNWNMRAKTFFYQQEYSLTMEQEAGVILENGVNSYPPTVPFIKTISATISGDWSDGAANTWHMLWYMSALVLFYFALRRSLSVFWSVLGTYALSSIAFFAIHGTVAYAEVLVALHAFVAVFSLVSAQQDTERRNTWLRLGVFAAALLTFTKNEGLILYLPAFGVVYGLTLLRLGALGRLTRSEALRNVVTAGLMVAAVVVPWLVFKWSHDLTFGNAKAVTGISFSFNAEVLRAMWQSTFLQGNWNLLFPLLLLIIAIRWRQALGSNLMVLTLFIALMWFLQGGIFAFTSIANEALNQTGYNRGVVQWTPLAVALMTMLLQKLISENSAGDDRLS